MTFWPTKTAVAILCFGGILFAIRFVPAFEQFTALGTDAFAAILDFRAGEPATEDTTAAFAHLVDRSHSLDRFYRALERVDAREAGAVVSILHFGDSPIAADQISADARELLQQRFGAAGAGFVLIARPWAWYNHRGIDLASRGWTVHAASQDFERDGRHGLGGAAFEGGPGASVRYVLSGVERRVEILYWTEPQGGMFDVTAGPQRLAAISTQSPNRGSAFGTVLLPAGARAVELRVTAGRVRLFGVSFESDGPGIRYHSLGLNAAQIRTVLDHFEPEHWAQQIGHQRPDLVVLNYGTNECGYPSYIADGYERDLRLLVRRVKAAAPDAAVLLMSPMDRGARDARGRISTLPALPKLVEIEQAVAAGTGCAFFNTFQAMGGEGTMARWYAASPRLASADFMHPLPAGAKRVGGLLERALYRGYLNYRFESENAQGERPGTPIRQ